MTMREHEAVAIEVLADPGNGLRRVISRRDTMGGAPIFEGTRLPVHHVGALVRQGVPMEELLEDFPRLTRAEIEWAAVYAERNPREERPLGRLKFIRES